VSRLVGGENQYGGARFAKDVAGSPQADANLRDVTGALRAGRGRRAGRRPNHKFLHVLVIVKLVSSHLAKSSAHSLQLRNDATKAIMAMTATIQGS
jgi:hypothetical protein